MYHHDSTPQYNKEIITISLLDPCGVVRVVYATLVLGMGVDLQGVNTILQTEHHVALRTTFKKVAGVDEVVVLLSPLCTGTQLIILQ